MHRRFAIALGTALLLAAPAGASTTAKVRTNARADAAAAAFQHQDQRTTVDTRTTVDGDDTTVDDHSVRNTRIDYDAAAAGAAAVAGDPCGHKGASGQWLGGGVSIGGQTDACYANMVMNNLDRVRALTGDPNGEYLAAMASVAERSERAYRLRHVPLFGILFRIQDWF